MTWIVCHSPKAKNGVAQAFCTHLAILHPLASFSGCMIELSLRGEIKRIYVSMCRTDASTRKVGNFERYTFYNAYVRS